MDKRRKDQVNLIINAYKHHRLRIREHEANIIPCHKIDLRCSRIIVEHIENAIELLPEDQRFIATKEIIEGKSGKWYTEYFSLSTYYRLREKTYSAFLNYL